MEKFIPYEKLSKSRRRELDRQKRGTWNGINPVTRRAKNAKIYDRKKARNGRDDFQGRAFCCSCIPRGNKI